MSKNKFFLGQNLWFDKETKPYQIKAFNNKFAICTKPFNLQKTVLYTIIDIEQNIRGTENLVFGMGFETTKDCEEALARLTVGETEVSSRNNVTLNIVRNFHLSKKFKNWLTKKFDIETSPKHIMNITRAYYMMLDFKAGYSFQKMEQIRKSSLIITIQRYLNKNKDEYMNKLYVFLNCA